MPRPEVTTSWNERTTPSTSWGKPRDSVIDLWSESILPWEETFFPWLYTGAPINTDWDDPRYDKFIEDLTGTNVCDLTGTSVTGISGNQVNKIDTEWT